MSPFSGPALFALSLLFSPAAFPHTAPAPSPTRDAQAVAVLTQALNAAGGLSAISAIQDYTATGTITYFWAGEQIQAPVTVRGMGIGNFRVDATLPQGTRTWSVSGLLGVLVAPDGARNPSAGYNLLTSGSMTLPHIRIASALADGSTNITYAGLVSLNGNQLHQVHFVMALDPSIAPLASQMPSLGSFDLFIDPVTFAVVRLTETVYSESNFKTALPHEIDFSGYQPTSGIGMPLLITEKINGQATWSIQVTSVTFNSGLTAAQFNP